MSETCILASYLSLPTGVASLPLAAVCGVAADIVPTSSTSSSSPDKFIVSRKALFCIVPVLSGLTSIATGLCQSIRQLFVMRLLNGGFMSGGVSVVFSILSDLFTQEQRNDGLGIISGQVYATRTMKMSNHHHHQHEGSDGASRRHEPLS
jgi:MFS family permease